MLLKNLISNLKPNASKIAINGISSDSRSVKKGDVFVSIKGEKIDANNFIGKAIKKGARVIFYSGKLKKNKKVEFIKVKDTRSILAQLASKYYKKKPKNIVAVTGTNGKTSVSDFFHQIFILHNKNVGFIGTLGFKKNKILKKRVLTTLDPINLNKDLQELKKDGIDNVIIEASSHGLKQKRLNYLKFKAGIFTNLSHDHLDYHKNMYDYLSSKLYLFSHLLQKNSKIITDSDIPEYKKIKKIQKRKKLDIYTIGTKSNIFKILDHKIFKNFQIIKIKYKKKFFRLKINLYGSIQIKNLLMAIFACNACGLKIENIFKKIDKIKSVEGRMQLIRTLPNKSKVFLDYAHTPDALKNAILSLKEHFQKKVTVIFGCGGERDKSKRILMGRIAKKYCSKIYITDDNPRNENPKKIRKDIMVSLKSSEATEIGNRKKAIITALQKSDPHEVILIAGKGHETYQDLGKRRIFLSDKDTVKNFNPSSKLSNTNMNNLKFNSSILKKFFKKKRNYLFNSVSINSKNIRNNNLFLAIKGKRNDGHDYLNEAIKNGANCCVVSKKNKKNSKFLYVKNTMSFLNKFALIKRELSSAKFIGVTGSSGKTTVKTMIGNLLNEYSNTFFSPESYNNRYGVPLSLCNINPSDDYGIFEIGMSKFREINKLSAMVQPHIGIITNISEAHLENFRDISDIAKAKSEIIYNIKKGGIIILNRDDKFFNYFKKVAKKNKIKVKSFGYSKQSDIRFIKIEKKSNYFLLKLYIDKKTFSLKVNNKNRSYIMNILSCVAIIDELNLPINKVYNFFKNQTFLDGRGKISKVRKYKKNFYLIDESYNANPLSVKSAIDNFSAIQRKGKKKYFLFGDMLELGKKSIFYHKKISKLINNSDIDKTFVYGKNVSETFKFLKRKKKGKIVKNLNSFNNEISKIIKNGDYLMIKGSNATKLHQVSQNILEGYKNAI